MQPIQIIPRYKLLLMYDIRPQMNDRYYRYVLGEFIPSVQEMGLYMYTAWHTAYGDYPMRHIELVTESLSIMRRVLKDDRFIEMEDRLKEYTENYSRKLVPFREGFQF